MGPIDDVQPSTPAAHVAAEQLGQVEQLDGVAKVLASLVDWIGPGPLKDALSGSWLGHPLHPLLTDLPLGTWTSATLLDVIGGEETESAADLLVAAGVLAALPTAAAGLTEWADSQKSNRAVRRIGVVHALANVVSLLFFAASLLVRRQGNRAQGKALSMAGMAALSAGGHLGGHLAYAKGVGVDQTVFEERPDTWTRILDEGALAPGQHRMVEVDGMEILVGRDEQGLFALGDRCCHRGAPLHEGRVANGEVTCPWHGSVFRLRDGSLVRGPAAYPQPAYDIRSQNGGIEIRARDE